MGEKIVSALNWALLSGKIYRQLNNVTLELADGTTTQIDHVIVSIHGVFVVETKNMSGWIFGSENDPTWTQSFQGGKKYRFQNPIRQNYRHLCSLIEFLTAWDTGLELSKNDIEKRLFSVVFFGPDAEIKTKEKLPDSVVVGSIRYIKSKTESVFDETEVNAIVDALRAGRLPAGLISGRATRQKHIDSLGERHRRVAGDACPKCGQTLVARAKKSDGKGFVGRSGFAKCRYIINTPLLGLPKFQPKRKDAFGNTHIFR